MVPRGLGPRPHRITGYLSLLPTSSPKILPPRSLLLLYDAKSNGDFSVFILLVTSVALDIEGHTFYEMLGSFPLVLVKSP